MEKPGRRAGGFDVCLSDRSTRDLRVSNTSDGRQPAWRDAEEDEGSSHFFPHQRLVSEVAGLAPLASPVKTCSPGRVCFDFTTTAPSKPDAVRLVGLLL